LRSLEDPGVLVSSRRAAMASRNLRRCPNDVTPSSFRSSAVRVSRTVSSMSFSRKIPSYFPEAQAPQPDHNVHNQRPPSGVAHIMVCLAECVQEASGQIIADRFTDIDLCKDDPPGSP